MSEDLASPSEAAEPPPKKPRRWLRRSVWTLVIALVLAATAVGGYFARDRDLLSGEEDTIDLTDSQIVWCTNNLSAVVLAADALDIFPRRFSPDVLNLEDVTEPAGLEGQAISRLRFLAENARYLPGELREIVFASTDEALNISLGNQVVVLRRAFAEWTGTLDTSKMWLDPEPSRACVAAYEAR